MKLQSSSFCHKNILPVKMMIMIITIGYAYLPAYLNRLGTTISFVILFFAIFAAFSVAAFMMDVAKSLIIYSVCVIGICIYNVSIMRVVHSQYHLYIFCK